MKHCFLVFSENNFLSLVSIPVFKQVNWSQTPTPKPCTLSFRLLLLLAFSQRHHHNSRNFLLHCLKRCCERMDSVLKSRKPRTLSFWLLLLLAFSQPHHHNSMNFLLHCLKRRHDRMGLVLNGNGSDPLPFKTICRGTKSSFVYCFYLEARVSEVEITHCLVFFEDLTNWLVCLLFQILLICIYL